MKRDPLSLYTTEEYKNLHRIPTIPFPKMLILNASSFCNFNCLQCPRQVKVPRREITGLGQGYMKIDLVQKLVNEFEHQDSFMGVLFALYGEPLMNPDIVDFVRIIKATGKNVQITTNGFFLKTDMAEKLIGAGLDKIKISFQGTTKEEYSYWRNNSYYDEIINNIDELINVRNTLKSDLFIQVGTSVANDTDEQIKEFMNYWSNRVDHVYYDYTGLLHLKEKDYVKDKSFRHEAVRREELCFDIFSRMTVLYNGWVPLCVDEEEHILANLYRQSISDVWHGEQFRANRQTILKEGNVLPPCKYCYTSYRKPIE